MTNPTTPDQGDERRAFEAHFDQMYPMDTDSLSRAIALSFFKAGRASLSSAQPVAQEAITPMPQPEPTSNGAKLLAAINAGTAFADGDAEAAWIAHSEHLNCPACGGSGHVDDVSSQQREPQEAASMPQAEPTDEEIIDLARVASTVNNYSNGRFASAIFEREHAIAFARAILAAAGGGEK